MPPPHEPHGLERFVAAQADTYATALAEIRAGRKRSHWMWFVFPQFAGLGHSATSNFYAIRSLDEARAAHGSTAVSQRYLRRRRTVTPSPASASAARASVLGSGTSRTRRSSVMRSTFRSRIPPSPPNSGGGAFKK